MAYIPPISSLSTDVLMEIFQINADMDKDGPLDLRYPITQNKDRAINTTRLSSQVSCFWRSLIVQAPILWANLIDLDFLHHTGYRWREEVIRRGQSSPLCVKGLISFKEYHISGQLWWLDFFNLNWPRIRELDLDVCFDRLADSQHFSMVKTLAFLSRSAPVLQAFRMKWENQWDLSKDGCLLFDNNAPKLQFFQIRNAQLSDKYSWVSQLRNLHIYRSDGTILTSVDVLYEVLSRMPLLESLYVEDTIPSPYIAPHRVPIHLPRLKYIQLRNNVSKSSDPSKSPTWPLLNYMIPGIGCSVRLLLQLPPSDDIDSNILSQLARNYFQVNQRTHLDLATHPNYFTLSDTREVGEQLLDELIPQTPFFNLTLDFHVQDILPPTDQRIYRLFKEMLSLSFPEVVELQIIVPHPHDALLKDHPQFLSSFTALKKLSTVPETLSYLYTYLSLDVRHRFPLLDVLEITVDQQDVPFIHSLLQNLVAFLQSRAEAGRPLSTFEYRCTYGPTFSEETTLLRDLTSLDTFRGLKVVWDFRSIGAGEYICGSGKPETLNFLNEYKNARRLRGFCGRDPIN